VLSVKRKSKLQKQEGREEYQCPQQQVNNAPLFLDRKIDEVTWGLDPAYSKRLNSIPVQNTVFIVNYILSMKTEVNLSDHYKKDLINLLTTFSKYTKKSFKSITRDDIIDFLESFRRPEASDPLHKWIGTYNLYRIHLMRFFKWLLFPDIEPNKRPKPEILDNIPQLKRKEKSIYRPTDLWTAEEDLLFLKYCPSKRMRCYHAVARDLGCRPHEILKLRISSISWRLIENRQYAEVVVNGKTGTRPLPLIDSIPYVKDYLDNEHPQPGNHNAIFISGTGKSLGRSISPESLNHIYAKYKNDLFPTLLNIPNVLPEDKQRIKELLKKPWNPYIRRHSSLTDKSKILKEHVLRQYAGWSTGSQMPQKYLHYFGNESTESILEAYGILPKGQQLDQLKPKPCPQCNELNKPDGKFCVKCRMVLTYDAYSDTIEEKQQKDSEVKELKQKYEQDMKTVREEMNQQFTQIMSMIRQNPQLACIKPEVLSRKTLE
jgi:integrase/recombinase XerD